MSPDGVFFNVFCFFLNKLTDNYLTVFAEYIIHLLLQNENYRTAFYESWISLEASPMLST